jgi:N-acetylmuramic acid 6-phosphate etherase
MNDPLFNQVATEQQNPRSRDLHKKTSEKLVNLFVEEEKFVQKALEEKKTKLTEIVEIASKTIQNGGKIFYVGCGTSGRLGVLDASEIPPTFSAEPELFQGIIAGGESALIKSSEGLEDKPELGAKDLTDRKPTNKDFVIGLAASGRTPYTRGALKKAKELGCKTAYITCNPQCDTGDLELNAEVHFNVGPEIITGSTRLKSGTLTKLALNIISSCAMIQDGRVFDNLMVAVKPSNEKLKARDTRNREILQKAVDLGDKSAQRILDRLNEIQGK